MSAEVQLRIVGPGAPADCRWVQRVGPGQQAQVLYDGRLVMSLSAEVVTEPHDVGTVTFYDKRVPQALFERICADTDRQLQELIGDGWPVIADMVRTAVARAFRCGCRHHSDAGSVYVEDVTCPLHRDTQPLAFGVDVRHDEEAS